MRYDWLILLRNDESSWGLRSALGVKTGRVFENSKILKWSNCHGWPTRWRKFFEVVKNTKIFHSREKCEDFSNWWKMQRFFKVGKNTEIFQSGLVVMGDLPRLKMKRFFQNGEKYKDFSEGRKNTEIFQRWKIQRFFKVFSWEKFEGGEKRKDFSKMVLLLWATGPNGRWKVFWKRSDYNGWPTQMKRQNVWNDMIGLDGERGLKSALERR